MPPSHKRTFVQNNNQKMLSSHKHTFIQYDNQKMLPSHKHIFVQCDDRKMLPSLNRHDNRDMSSSNKHTFQHKNAGTMTIYFSVFWRNWIGRSFQSIFQHQKHRQEYQLVDDTQNLIIWSSKNYISSKCRYTDNPKYKRIKRNARQDEHLLLSTQKKKKIWK